MNTIRSIGVNKGDQSSETNVNNGKIFPSRCTCTYVLVCVPGVWLCVQWTLIYLEFTYLSARITLTLPGIAICSFGLGGIQ